MVDVKSPNEKYLIVSKYNILRIFRIQRPGHFDAMSRRFRSVKRDATNLYKYVLHRNNSKVVIHVEEEINWCVAQTKFLVRNFPSISNLENFSSIHQMHSCVSQWKVQVMRLWNLLGSAWRQYSSKHSAVYSCYNFDVFNNEPQHNLSFTYASSGSIWLMKNN